MWYDTVENDFQVMEQMVNGSVSSGEEKYPYHYLV
jgi:hypothetical protein